MLDLEKIYEALVFWRGNVNATEFADAVGQSRQHVQASIITPLSQNNPDLVQQRGRKHGRTLSARPKAAPGDLWSFFNLLATERVWRRRKHADLPSLASFAVEDLSPPDVADPASWVSRAAGQKCALTGNYLFKNHGVCTVCFSPHAMVRTPRRIHFRGHLVVWVSGESQDWGYVDLVPSRFLDDGNLGMDKLAYRGAGDDDDWHEEVEIFFEINPDLPKNAFLALQHEHRFETDEDGPHRIRIPTRKALVYSWDHHVFDRVIGPSRMKAWVRCSTSD